MRPSSKRYPWVDTARALGMFLVYYGHVVEQVYRYGLPHAFEQFKLIYSFHMALFFFVAGFFWRPTQNFPLRGFRLLALRRILPALTFGALLLPIWVFQACCKNIPWQNLRRMVFAYLRGSPGLNAVTWFLICLFTCEVIATLILPRFRSRSQAALFGLLSLVAGLFICSLTGTLTHFGASSKALSVNAWYLPESIVALGLYALGFACFPQLASTAASRPRWSYMLIPLSCAVLLFSYRLNVPHGGFVDMAVSDHGQAAPFLVSALSGILFVLALAGLLPSSRIFSFVGRNTLIYLGFNGLFFHFLNAAIVKWWLAQYGLTNITLFCSAVTILSMLLCVPFAFVANRFIPQLVGRIDRVGPILPALGESQTKPPEKHRGIMARSLGPKGVSTEPRGYS